MSNAEFDAIYREAMLSATGREIDDPSIRAAHDTFVAKDSERMLNAWTNDSFDTSVRTLSSHKSAENLHILHPEHTAFTEEDLAAVARTRYLGHFIIDTAKSQLMANPEFTSHLPMDSADLFDFFQFYYWAERHPKPVEREAGSNDPDIASPLRLKDWPNGENINCLGISIGLAAACELNRFPYVYANEIRNSDSVLSERHKTFMDRVRQHVPYFDDGNTQKMLRETIQLYRGEDKLYDDILYKTPDTLSTKPRVRDFHHFVVVQEADELGDYWIQVDPFDLSYESIRAGRDIAFEPFFTSGNENSVVLSDEHQMVDTYYRHFHTALEIAVQRAARIRTQYQDPAEYKSAHFIENIESAAVGASIEVLRELYGGANEDEAGEKQLDNDKAVAKNLLSFNYLICGKALPEIIQLRDDVLKKGKKSFNADNTIAALSQCLADLAQHNPQVRSELVDHIANIPVLAIVHMYEVNLKKSIRIRECGAANTVFELADPEFMIGAMYMNHYATWRKDGRINIARQLARICSSQLLWQAALQDETGVDERVVALGETIKSLKPRQLHPLVNIASGIHVPSTR